MGRIPRSDDYLVTITELVLVEGVIMIDRIHHVGIVVHSADKALEFFRDTMGL